ncbi:RlmE family RNA methyltransferase [Methanoculleus sp. FWC-SCC1]|uniref:Ribosomal RNA large subunit methyltransferase E n=1 Tax=Methanoculleus frigidifontis TaxID=2584085 RepID=A0ABT8M6G5_9EURY|nr:RlmE family RNA methyltransferase [Methanoculleus sp. FWC-SCC1]MDN7023529.1 RlmE family RNA methyltransferase [Methanoculleus sp. FWC-SCC1]
MGSQWARDKVYTRAMKAGYRSRAAYKLLEVQERNEIIRPDDNVVDLGAAPGSWLQVLRELTDGKIVGVDVNPIAPIEGVTTIVGDFTESEVQERICADLEVVNVVVSDASPKLSGQKSYDQARAVALGEEALAFACNVLKPGGNLVIKSFQGELFADLMNEIKEHFRSVRGYRTKASRKGSAETYIIAKNFIG